MALFIYIAFTAAAVMGMAAFTVRLVTDKPLFRSFMVMAPVIGILLHLLLVWLGYEGLALYTLGLAAAIVIGSGIVYAIAEVPLDELLFPPKETVRPEPVRNAAPPPAEMQPTRHAHLRVVSSSRSVP